MAGQAVLHYQKNGKILGGSLGHHIDREEGKEYSYRHADLSKTKENIYIQVNELCRSPYNEAIAKRIEQGYNHKNKAGELKAIRKDAVHSINVILSGSHEEMKEIAKDKLKLQRWIDKNLEFCKNEYGAQNITRFAVHLDEKTPHIHCVFVPITSDGRLSAGDWMKTGKQLEEVQSKYAEAMAEFGLERGVKSERKHHTTEEYRQRERYKLNDNKEILQDLENLKQSDVFSFKTKKAALFAKLENLILNQDQTTKKQIEALKSEISSLERKLTSTLRQQNELPKSKFLSQEQIESIVKSISVKDYFFYLMERGKVDFEKKSGGEFYFKTGTQKFSVSDKGYFDFKSNQGGQIIKAVMEMEGMKWKEALDFLQKFSGTNYDHLSTKIAEEHKSMEDNRYNLTAIMRPNNYAILEYYHSRGIDEETVKNHLKQIHYQIRTQGQDFHFFGVGLKNNSGGWDIRSTTDKTKLGTSDISEAGNPNSEKIVVFEGMSDMLAFIQKGKDEGHTSEPDRLICLNSANNVQKFIEQFQYFKGKIYTCLDADEKGETATRQIKQFFPSAIDLREHYGIHQGRGGSKDFNEVLMKEKGLIQQQNRGRNWSR
jgi:hypothetical protein